jgi:hypothetical protein
MLISSLLGGNGIVRHCQHLDYIYIYIASKGMMTDEGCIFKCVESNGHGVIEILSRNLFKVTGENHEKYQSEYPNTSLECYRCQPARCY